MNTLFLFSGSCKQECSLKMMRDHRFGVVFSWVFFLHSSTLSMHTYYEEHLHGNLATFLCFFYMPPNLSLVRQHIFYRLETESGRRKDAAKQCWAMCFLNSFIPASVSLRFFGVIWTIFEALWNLHRIQVTTDSAILYYSVIHLLDILTEFISEIAQQAECNWFPCKSSFLCLINHERSLIASQYNFRIAYYNICFLF